MRPYSGDVASEPARSLELASVTANTRHQHSLSSSTDTSSTPGPLATSVGLIGRPHCSPPLARRLVNTTVLCCLCLGVSVALLFVILFIAIPTVSRSPPILVPVPPTTDSKPTAENITEWLDKLAVSPVMCHSHNDYWRPRPLISALMAGCTGIEADVWLTDDGQDLLVGHDRPSPAPQNTLKAMYLDPLLDILDLRNREDAPGSRGPQDQAAGVFRGRSQAPVVLMVDVKENAAAVWKVVLQQIEPFRQRGYLRRYENGTVRPGPLVVVGSGGLQLDTLLRASSTGPGVGPPAYYRDTFLDAPLGELSEASVTRWEETYNTTNSYYASASFGEAIGPARAGLSEAQLGILRRQARAARSSGLHSRYWGTPGWPINYRDYIWGVLTREGVGVLSVDDVDGAAKQSWATNYLGGVDGMIAATCVLLLTVVLLVGYGVLKNRRASALLARHTVF